MTVIITSAIFLIAVSVILFINYKSNFETTLAEKDLIINSLRTHVINLEAAALLQTEEIKKLKLSMKTSGVSISGISTSAIESESKKRPSKKK